MICVRRDRTKSSEQEVGRFSRLSIPLDRHPITGRDFLNVERRSTWEHEIKAFCQKSEQALKTETEAHEADMKELQAFEAQQAAHIQQIDQAINVSKKIWQVVQTDAKTCESVVLKLEKEEEQVIQEETAKFKKALVEAFDSSFKVRISSFFRMFWHTPPLSLFHF